jgi:hypothetical protein
MGHRHVQQKDGFLMVGLPLNHVNRRIVALFCILLVLLSALIAVPIAAQEPLPDPTLQAGASGDFPQGSPVFGPADGELVHDPSDDQVVTSYIDFPIANFVAEATFVTPYDDSSVGWSHGFFFRDTADAQLRLIFDSVGNWELTLYTNEEFTTLQSGTISIAETEKGSRNTLRLAADGDSGLFSLNGEIVAALDLSALVGSGDLAIGTGLYTPEQNWRALPLSTKASPSGASESRRRSRRPRRPSPRYPAPSSAPIAARSPSAAARRGITRGRRASA